MMASQPLCSLLDILFVLINSSSYLLIPKVGSTYCEGQCGTLSAC